MHLSLMDSIEDLSWSDIDELAKSGATETSQLEFKSGLPEQSGQPARWLRGEDVLSRYSRDQLAHEVVAFANAYGGTLLIGIIEDKGRPPTAQSIEALPRAEALADKLEEALRSDLIDPPIASLQVRSILKPGSNGEGIVVVKVSASDLEQILFNLVHILLP